MAPEGLKYVVPMAAVTVVCVALFGNHGLTYVSAGLCLAFLLFFRPPPRPVDAAPSAVLSPAGGWVIEIVREDEPRFFKGPAQRVSIFMTPLDVHVNVAPVDGTVRFVEYRPGAFFKADRNEARMQNEQNSVGIERPGGARVMATQIAGWLARRIVCDVKPGDAVTRGRRFGMIEFSSRVDVHLPPEAKVLVRPGLHVRAARTILAEIP